MFSALILFLTICSLVLVFISNNVSSISEIYLFFLGIVILVDYLRTRTFTLFQVWQFGFVFIILSEALLLESQHDKILEAVKYLIIANNVIILGYLFSTKSQNFKIYSLSEDSIKRKKWIQILLFLMGIIFVVYKFQNAWLIFKYGRIYASIFNIFDDKILLLSSFTDSIGLILPALIAFYFIVMMNKKSFILPFLFSLPIFVILFMGGTRFPLLFSFMGFLLVVNFGKRGNTFSFKYQMLILIFLLVIASTIMKSFRSTGFENYPDTPKGRIALEKPNKIKWLAMKMSPEGVVDMTALMMDHFDDHPHLYGKSSSFLFYFWIPRDIWPNKPTMLGYWLIRSYRSGFSEGHSASFGFAGDLYADFGYFSLVLIFVLGILLNRLDQFCLFHFNLESKSLQKIIAAMLYPYVFFFVRSPITSTMTFLGVYLIYFIFKKQTLNVTY
jgi:hypothetical protein